MAILTVRDVEAMAKAGVTINFADVRDHLAQSEPYSQDREMAVLRSKPQTLTDAFWERWERTERVKYAHSEMGGPFAVARRWEIHAHKAGEIIHVVVCPHDEAPIIIEDSISLYPSDALMTALTLREKAK
jgi:hypothetical protein